MGLTYAFVLILLPPSEGKSAPRRGKPLELAGLSSPGLMLAREQTLDALARLCSEDPAQAAQLLGVPKSQLGLVELNVRARTSPTARADAIYTGVLYDALDVASLTPSAKRRAAARLAITSSLFGLVRPGDRIPAYRLSGDAVLPGLGSIAAHWRTALDPVLGSLLRTGLLVDLRSGMYAAFWRPPAELSPRVATVRVLHEVDGIRQVVSHFNKATKGRIVRALLEDGRAPRTPVALAAVLADLGWQVEVGDPSPKGTQLDVIVTDITS